MKGITLIHQTTFLFSSFDRIDRCIDASMQKRHNVAGMGTVNDSDVIGVFGRQQGRIQADETECVFGF